ncbi:MAG: deoxyuridine 5'-triphosphate nucleotidohydrolase [Candidatus Aenigmarchaeota archaeon]|nr:deoxyuridine 5'-triphosphate nucleotidohydrolase [Candidatus Aenigmarchaeota archaeon]MCX8190593.1 deoxyuridine 5'-triphosphate nucleotidohydrolase [Candidatus Aenigmarchaeota archaeon]MDW8160136.1 deoxyuridine 5'-triphosphate nucleotidohydrolase [Candidatus Aenigmarchaeota archaeon]
MILSDKEIKEKIEEEKLIENFIDLNVQLQPASFDLTLDEVFLLESQALIDFDNKERRLPIYKKIEVKGEYYELQKGCYLITFNEILNIPKDLIGLLRPRSSLVRSGASIFSSLWDPGYSGKSNCLLVVFNDNGIKLKKSARIAQMIFLKLNKPPEKTYSGIYQKEGITKKVP